MKVAELSPGVTSRVQFSLRYQMQLPDEAGCYVLATFEDEVLYVGLTDNLRRRFRQHRNSEDKCDVTLAGRTFWFYFLQQPEKEIRRVERSWQNQYSSTHGKLPVLNKVASPVA